MSAFGPCQSNNDFEHRNGLAAGFPGELSTQGNSSHIEMCSPKRCWRSSKESPDLPAKWGLEIRADESVSV